MQVLPIHTSLAPFVKEILLLESKEDTKHTLPFYADGFAGIAYTKSQNPFYIQPLNKKLSNFYLFGQTIDPMQLIVEGSYKMIALRLYPFASRILIGVDPKELNDDCYNLHQVKNINTGKTVKQLDETDDNAEIITILIDYFNELLQNASRDPDNRVRLATNLILKANGAISIKEIRDRLYITERTLERNFLKEIGVTPKQFAKIIQFSTSMKQMSEADYISLTDVAYDSGYTDQSHFIRSFKQFTGKTPKEIQKQISA